MSLCPSSSHQLVAAAIAFRRARRKFPKDFGLESTIERTSENIKAETATSREGPINQAKSSSTLVKRACNSRYHVCPASARNRNYDYSYGKENSISCSCCRTRNGGEDISELRDELCSGGDAIDTVPSRECEEIAASSVDREKEFVKLAEHNRCDGEATKRTGWIPQSATFHHHHKARCSSGLCPNSDPVNLPCESASRERNGKVARGDFSGDKGKEFGSTSHRETPIDLEGNAEVGVVISNDRGPRDAIEDAWTKTRRKVADSARRCQCEGHPCKESVLDLLRSTCDRCCDHRHRDHLRDCCHRHRCCQQRDIPSAAKCETHGRGIADGRVRHKSWRDQQRDENSRLYARQCYSKEYSGIIAASRERNDEEKDDDDDDDEEDEDGGVAVINHKDSMCILAEKYKAGRKCNRDGRCEDKARSDDRMPEGKDECNKSLTSEIIDQPDSPSLEVPHEEPSVKHACRGRCEGCGTAATARTSCSRGCVRHAPPEGEFDRLRSPLNETTVTRCCSSRAPCRRAL